jgi:dCTP deaminase
MLLIRDAELKILVQRPGNPLLTNFDRPVEWDSKDSLVQPCSIDLHIGKIYQPGIKAGKEGSATKPRWQLVLSTGQTAVVETQEAIHLPGDYAGFGFPPSHVSANGLLMTNPGHVDPGYSGTLRFTVINMGRDSFVLSQKAPIVTLLIFQLSQAAEADYAQRDPNRQVATFQQDDLDKLSPDFVDVTRRARTEATRIWGGIVAAASVIGVILTWGVNQWDKRLEGVDELRRQVIQLQDSDSVLKDQLQSTKQELEKELSIDERLRDLEAHKPAVGGTPGAAAGNAPGRSP